MPQRDAGWVARIAVGAGLILLGVLFLVVESLDVRIVANAWPLIVIAVGAAFFAGMIAGGEGAGPLAIPGSIVTIAGVVLFVQNSFGLWETWTYVWPLVSPGGVGVGLWVFGVWSRKPRLRVVGYWMTFWSVVAFAVLGAFFELFIGLTPVSDTVVGRVLFPSLLVLAGIVLALRGPQSRMK